MSSGRSPVTTTEAHNAWAGRGAVVLDIGGDVGALVVAMPPMTVGREVEIRPLGRALGLEHGHLAHVAVVRRPVAGGTVPSLVFGSLVAGRYELFEKGRPEWVALRTTVLGGAVTSAVWPD